MELTEHQRLVLAAVKAAMESNRSPHPTLDNKTYGQMTDRELQQIIAWHKYGELVKQ